MAGVLKRGEIWTVSGGTDYTGKPRPAAIIQNDCFDDTGSITFCPLTTRSFEIRLFRLDVTPTESNGLQALSFLMVDKIGTIPKTKIGFRVGRLASEDMVRLDQAIILFLGLRGA
jgi:mRNA interferase MazF